MVGKNRGGTTIYTHQTGKKGVRPGGGQSTMDVTREGRKIWVVRLARNRKHGGGTTQKVRKKPRSRDANTSQPHPAKKSQINRNAQTKGLTQSGTRKIKSETKASA